MIFYTWKLLGILQAETAVAADAKPPRATTGYFQTNGPRVDEMKAVILAGGLGTMEALAARQELRAYAPACFWQPMDALRSGGAPWKVWE